MASASLMFVAAVLSLAASAKAAIVWDGPFQGRCDSYHVNPRPFMYFGPSTYLKLHVSLAACQGYCEQMPWCSSLTVWCSSDDDHISCDGDHCNCDHISCDLNVAPGGAYSDFRPPAVPPGGDWSFTHGDCGVAGKKLCPVASFGDGNKELVCYVKKNSEQGGIAMPEKPQDNDVALSLSSIVAAAFYITIAGLVLHFISSAFGAKSKASSGRENDAAKNVIEAESPYLLLA